jgi:N,N'-diacetyllegionaminate synthase|tara:strand:+ start:251 stop:1297 length:1047 start_codon:yes stop_codon:yes gene_type:complete
MNYEDLLKQVEPRAIFIAEAGINHDGNLETAKKMVDAAVKAGADYVKFQSFKAEKLVTPDALTSSYIKEGSHNGESFEELLRRLELSRESHYVLKEYCDERGIKFLSTAFDKESFDFLLELGIDVIKIASGDLTNIPFLCQMALTKLPIILSTGMGSLAEIEEAVEAITVKGGNNSLVLMHCISWYPAEICTSNLRFMETLKKAFGYPVGYSDHTLGINVSIAARALGAVVLEKHFTMDSTQFGPDHSASIEPEEMIGLVKGIREIEEALGSSVRQFCKEEISQKKVHRRSIIAKAPIEKGKPFTEENLTIKRPGIGMKPKHWYAVIGKKATRRIKSNELISWSDIER